MQSTVLQRLFQQLIFVITLLASVIALPVAAQDAAADASDAIVTAIQKAADAGVNVVVIDTAGRVVTGEGAVDPADPSAAEADPMESASMLMKTQSRVDQFRKRLSERVQALPSSFNEVAFILRATSPDGRIMTYVEVLLWSGLLFVISRFLTTETYGKRFAKRFVVGRIKDDPEGYREKMPFLVFRFFMGVGGTLFSMTIAYVIGYLIFGEVDDLSVQLTISAVYVAYFIGRTISDLWRMILSPFLSQYRIPVFSDRDAKTLYYWLSLNAGVSIATSFFGTWIADFGLNYNAYAILYGLMSLIGLLLVILMVLVNARAITNAIRHGRPHEDVSVPLRLVSVFWAPAFIVYIIFGWLKLSYDLVLENPISIPMIAGAFGVFLSMIVVYGTINYVIERFFNRSFEVERLNAEMSEADAEEDGVTPVPPAPRMTTFEELARRVAGILALVAGSYAMLRIWDPSNSILNDSIVDRLLDVTTILFIGYILYHFFRIWIDTKIDEETPEIEEAEPGDEGGAGSASRLATLLPLFRGAILAIVVVTIALIALMELGINVSPLFAGAGVVGLAVGFGAQTLVRDIFSGAFFLIDDAFRKGEYIDIGGVKGTVEKISVRSFQLRHHLGALNTIPFGEIRVLTNYSRDWVIMKLPLRVTYDTDVERVRKLIKKLGQELLNDPVIGDNFIQPLKSQGVIEMQDSAMIIRVKFMTKPGDQWLVRKKVYEEIRQLFEREGIRFAHREVTVRLADGEAKDLNKEQREAVLGAAQAAIDEEEMTGGVADTGDDR